AVKTVDDERIGARGVAGADSPAGVDAETMGRSDGGCGTGLVPATTNLHIQRGACRTNRTVAALLKKNLCEVSGLQHGVPLSPGLTRRVQPFSWLPASLF